MFEMFLVCWMARVLSVYSQRCVLGDLISSERWNILAYLIDTHMSADALAP